MDIKDIRIDSEIVDVFEYDTHFLYSIINIYRKRNKKPFCSIEIEFVKRYQSICIYLTSKSKKDILFVYHENLDIKNVITSFVKDRHYKK